MTDAPHPDLLAAYAQTDYVFVAHNTAYRMRVGGAHPAVATLMYRHGVRSAAFITACNPYSGLRSHVFNKLAQIRLRRTLQTLPEVVAIYPGEGRDPQGQWPSEASFMVLGLEPRQAAKLGKRFGQNAVLSISMGGDVELQVLA